MLSDSENYNIWMIIFMPSEARLEISKEKLEIRVKKIHC